jgi:photosystem II stability/assembly factor-like uncharacterized protein
MAAQFQEEYSVPLALHPKNADIIYAALAKGPPTQWRRRPSGAEGCLIQSTDGGKSWEKLNGEISKASRSFVEALTFDPSDSDRLYAAQRNGELFGSLDSGDNWFKLTVSVPEVSDMKAARA